MNDNIINAGINQNEQHDDIYKTEQGKQITNTYELHIPTVLLFLCH